MGLDPRYPSSPATVASSGAGSGGVWAVVNGQPILADRLIDILLQTHGADLLEQIIALDSAKHLAAQMGIAMTESDAKQEYDRTLQRLYDPLAAVNVEAFDRQAAERLLDTLLASRGSSRAELRLVVERNAYLRKIAFASLRVSSEQLQQTFLDLYGERVQVRHIQLATLAQVERAQASLRSGTPFSQVARRHSANTASAGRGGLLEPFTAADPAVPAMFREVAFGLGAGESSAPFRSGRWFHIVRVVRRLPTEAVSLGEVRDEVEAVVRERLAEAQMEDLFNSLVAQADVTIVHPVLRDAYRAKSARGRDASMEQMTPPPG